MNIPRSIIVLLSVILATGLSPNSRAATFDGSTRLSIADSTQSLSWNAASSALTVSCWAKFSIPSGVTLTENMMILTDRNTGTWNGSNQLVEIHSYAIYLSSSTGNIEFSSRGPGGYFIKTLVEKPFLERWYHLAVVRGGASINGYVDARRMFSDGISVGDSKSTDGVSIGGIGAGMYLRGEAQEVQIFRGALSQTQVAANRFLDLNPALWTSLKGYYKLSAAANPPNQLDNSASSPEAGTNPAVKAGTGTIAFETTNRDGEQSLFDATKNGGKDAITPLSGGFDWQQTILSRPTPGVPFDFSISYSSGNAFNKAPLEDFDPFQPASLGVGWRHNFEIRVLPNSAFNPSGSSQSLGLMISDGNIETWDFLGSSGSTTKFKTRHKEYRGDLEFVGSSFDPESTVRWITPERLVYVFRSPYASSGDALTLGRLKEIQDLNGNRLAVAIYEAGDKAGLVNTVTDTSGGVWTFNYSAQNLLQSVTGLGWTVNFTYDGSNRLATRSLTGPAAYDVPASTTWQFQYTAADPTGLVYRINDPRGNRAIEVAYDKYGRKTTEWDGVGRITTTQYNVPALRQMTTTRQAGDSPVPANDRTVVDTFDRKLHVITHRDALGFVVSFEYNEAGNVVAATDAKGYRSVMTYDSRSNMLTTNDPLGRTTRREYNHILAGGIPHNQVTKEIRPGTEEAPSGWENRFTYDTAGNLLTHSDDIGTLALHTYDAKGLVTSSKDGNGNEVRFGYDTNGFQNSRTIAFGTPQAATWTSVRTELGWMFSETNPLQEPTRLSHNLYGQVTRTEDAIGRNFTRLYDANGNLTDESDGNGVLTKYQYNAADERIRRTYRLSNVWEFEYNSFGELHLTRSPTVLSDGTTQQDTVTNSYDANGRLIRVTDPYNDFSSFEYDANGNQTASIDKLGKRWENTYDALDRVVAERDPDGNVKRVFFDAAGRVKTVATPNGFPSTHEYDGRSRLRVWKDAEGFRWIYTYDGAGNILNIEDALGGHYVMTYGPRNERLSELNQDFKSWTYTYDPLIRLKTQLDPNGTGKTLSYDAVGRLDSLEFSTGRINSHGYDNNNNVVSVVRTKPGTASTALNLDYDDLDRLTETRDAFSRTVRYSYDSIGRVRTKTYPGGKVLTQTYDRLGRLKGLSFAWSASQTHTCSFTYDKAGRLTRRTYPNGIIQTNGFDDSGRLKSLEYKSGGESTLIALDYAYDRNGNKIGGSEQGTLDWQAGATPNFDEKSRFTAAGKLIDRTDTDPTIPKVMNYTYDNSGNMTLAATPGESYSLAYDEDNRTTSIQWENGLSSKDIINRYDALGRRISRKADGIETRYVLDLVGGMERTLCDTDSSGNIQTWYVHGPDLGFKVSNAGTITCYHSDAMGNVVRTTDTAGATVNEYAYTPYGRSLDTADSAPDLDPFRFVGSQGVMLELPGLYFMRARYYSADAGVFLATDPVKNIGPGWKSVLHGYAAANPILYNDPRGEFVMLPFLIFTGFYYIYEQTTIRPLNSVVDHTELMTKFYAGATDEEDILDFELDTLSKGVAGGDVVVGLAKGAVGLGWEDLGKSALGYIPYGQTVLLASGIGSTVGYASYGIERDLKSGKKTSSPSGNSQSSMSNRTTAAETVATSTNKLQTTKAETAANRGSGGGGGAATGTNSGEKLKSGGGGSSSYTVKSGDTLGNIAYKNGTTATALGAANGIKNLNLIKPGQVLNIPKKK
jgi:RHS repeat-associated protein